MIGSAMLITCCPECETTFRISVGILEKAGGQVRCGRCAKIFDANVDLREIDETETESKPVSEFKFELAPDPEVEAEEVQAEPEAAVVEHIELATDELEAEATEEESEAVEAESDSELESIEVDDHALKTEEVETKAAEPDWLAPMEDQSPRRIWPWTVGASVLCLTLAGQLIHQFRSELITVPTIGPALEQVYSLFGIEVLAPVDLNQFDLLDLTALAEPASDEQGWLIIETRVQNKGPKVQAYPHIFVRLEDRWEDTVAGRYFSPQEYTVSTVSGFSRMNVGTTIDAQFIIMDPGPSATGFELELCARIVRGFKCESDSDFR